jgi:tetratricopeptide (TPR) repeat protein
MKFKCRIYYIFTIATVIFFGCNQRATIKRTNVDTITLKGKELLDYQYAFTEATKQKIFGNTRQAASLFHKCLEAKPYSSAAHYQLGDLYLKMGNPRLAIRYSKNAIELDKENYWYHQQLVRTYQTAGYADSALMAYNRIIEIFPGNENYLLSLALLYAENEKYNESIKIFKQIEKIKGPNPKVAMQMHELYYQQGKKEKALAVLKEYLKLLPGNKDLILMHAVTLGDNGEKESAKKEFQKYIDIFGIDKEVYLTYYNFLIQNGNIDGVIDLMYNHLPSENIADEIILQSFLVFLENDPTREQIFEILNLFETLEEKKDLGTRYKTIKADYLIKVNNLTEAASLLEEVVEVEKKNPVIWEQLILIYSNIHKWQKVYTLAGEALLYFPGESNFYHLQGYAFTRAEKYEKGIVSLETGLDNCIGKCNKEKFYKLLAESYYQVGNFKQSFYYFEEILKNNPDDVQAMNNYSYYLAETGNDLNKAKKLSRSALQYNPDHYPFLDTYAWILYKEREFKKAKDYAESALKNGGHGDVEVLYHYGMILLENREKKNANLIFEKALSLGIDDNKIREQIKNLLESE